MNSESVGGFFGSCFFVTTRQGHLPPSMIPTHLLGETAAGRTTLFNGKHAELPKIDVGRRMARARAAARTAAAVTPAQRTRRCRGRSNLKAGRSPRIAEVAILPLALTNARLNANLELLIREFCRFCCQECCLPTLLGPRREAAATWSLGRLPPTADAEQTHETACRSNSPANAVVVAPPASLVSNKDHCPPRRPATR